MNRPQGLIGLAAICAAALVGIGGCVTPTTVNTVEKGINTARGVYVVTCGNVLPAHDAGLLTGTKFNIVKNACVKANGYLNDADSALSLGKTAEASEALANGNANLAIATSNAK